MSNKGRGDWKDKAIRFFTRGQYSHCEMAVANGDEWDCYTSSPRDGGVRMKTMKLSPTEWDLIKLPESWRFSPNDLAVFAKGLTK